ncbi:hypothetical protein BC937DRAFT_93072 [Endogone sp. FLAS-F59071]|nr:hypothetical protein BC937DRAFT_93072 [Endogone sp. FLAS-F59071]|eukprot:RUS14974.1 hypothetical protein BC937DRAFT_93072 [Endogone sp. FLAS-F59071]
MAFAWNSRLLIVPRFARPFQTITSLYASRRRPGPPKAETLVDYLAQPHNTASTLFKGTSFELEAKEALEHYVVSESRTAPVIGVLVTSDKNFTKSVLAAFKECELPLALAKIADGKVKSMLLNSATEELLPGYAFTTRFTEQGTSEAVLTLDGCIVEFADLTSREG